MGPKRAGLMTVGLFRRQRYSEVHFAAVIWPADVKFSPDDGNFDNYIKDDVGPHLSLGAQRSDQISRSYRKFMMSW